MFRMLPQWIFSKEECNEAAFSLGLGDINATEVFEGDYENGASLPHCFGVADTIHNPSACFLMINYCITCTCPGIIQRSPVYGCYVDTFSSATGSAPRPAQLDLCCPSLTACGGHYSVCLRPGQLFYYKPTKKFDPADFLDYSNSEEGLPRRLAD